MRIGTIIISSMFYCFGINSQPALNKTYGTENANLGYSIIPESNGYFIEGGGYSPQFNNWFSIKLYRIDSLGNLLWEQDYGRDHSSFGSPGTGCTKMTWDSGYIVPGGRYDSSTTDRTAFLIRFDSRGDTIWTRTFGSGSFDQFNSCVITPGKSFVATGEVTSLGNALGDVYLVKVDSAGNTLWEKTFGGPGGNVALQIDILDDGGFLITGGTNIDGNTQNYLIRTDSSGNLVWQKNYGRISGDNGGCSGYHSKDGGFVIGGLWDTLYNNGTGDASYIAKLDSNGNIKWIHFFNDSITLNQNRELPDGSIVTVGQKLKPTPNNSSSWGGVIIKFDSIGDQLWQTLLIYNGGGDLDTTYEAYYFGAYWDFQLTNDGGFALTGTYIYDTLPSGFEAQKMWLVKTDSNGCVDNVCGIEGIETIENSAVFAGLTVYPNPAYETVTFRFDLPEFKETYLALYDIYGQQVLRQPFYNESTVDISNLANGFYLAQVFNNNEAIASEKLIILR